MDPPVMAAFRASSFVLIPCQSGTSSDTFTSTTLIESRSMLR